VGPCLVDEDHVPSVVSGSDGTYTMLNGGTTLDARSLCHQTFATRELRSRPGGTRVLAFDFEEYGSCKAFRV
jgi:hypothetical protein